MSDQNKALRDPKLPVTIAVVAGALACYLYMEYGFSTKLVIGIEYALMALVTFSIQMAFIDSPWMRKNDGTMGDDGGYIIQAALVAVLWLGMVPALLALAILIYGFVFGLGTVLFYCIQGTVKCMAFIFRVDITETDPAQRKP
jgi:hypothetical protein